MIIIIKQTEVDKASRVFLQTLADYVKPMQMLASGNSLCSLKGHVNLLPTLIVPEPIKTLNTLIKNFRTKKVELHV